MRAGYLPLPRHSVPVIHMATYPSGRRGQKLVPKSRSTAITDTMALDCEMVGVGCGGSTSALARVCVVRSRMHSFLKASALACDTCRLTKEGDT